MKNLFRTDMRDLTWSLYKRFEGEISRFEVFVGCFAFKDMQTRSFPPGHREPGR